MSDQKTRNGLTELQDLLKRAKVVSYQQVNDLLPDDFDGEGGIDAIYETIRSLGIELVDSDDLDEIAIPVTPPAETQDAEKAAAKSLDGDEEEEKLLVADSGEEEEESEGEGDWEEDIEEDYRKDWKERQERAAVEPLGRVKYDDPVWIYMREMGRVPLLDRQG